jgi:glutathione synthase/RimK-type ligase-like ATP-grasp enzyme
MEDLQPQKMVPVLTAHLAPLIEQTLAPLKTDRFELSVYFGRSPIQRYNVLAGQLFDLLQAPLLRAGFERCGGRWHIRSIRLVVIGELSGTHRRFLFEAAAAHFAAPERAGGGQPPRSHALAILYNPTGTDLPSNPEALAKFAETAGALGMEVDFITPGDFDRLPQFDALFIRDTTYVHHYTYWFARRAQGEGLLVIDDPDSILKCNNKVYLAELLAHHNLPTPRTLLIHRGNVDQVAPLLALPCVLKQPDSSFSSGVEKVETERELRDKVGALLRKSDLIVAQEWLPTEFDWRVGVLDRRVIFVCKYYMAEGHWQIIDRGGEGQPPREGRTEALAVGEAPEEVVELALRAANLIGDGFYGVDIKQAGNRWCIIEINDNPNVDAGNEDGVLGDALYREVMGVFLRRLERRRDGEDT